jgi:hypothetical protein
MIKLLDRGGNRSVPGVRRPNERFPTVVEREQWQYVEPRRPVTGREKFNRLRVDYRDMNVTSLDRQQILALLMVFFMIGSSVAYVLAFAL